MASQAHLHGNTKPSTFYDSRRGKAISYTPRKPHGLKAAEQALESFEKKWQARFPSIARSWRSNWTNIIPFFSYPPAIRKVIYTTSAIESMQAQLRKVTRNRGAFPSPESVRKILYLAIER